MGKSAGETQLFGEVRFVFLLGEGEVNTKEMNLFISDNDRSFILNLLSRLRSKFVHFQTGNNFAISNILENRVNIYKRCS